MKLHIALAVCCQTHGFGELNLETSLAVETRSLNWQLQLEEVIVHRARKAARNLAQQVSATLDRGATPERADFVPLAESIQRRADSGQRGSESSQARGAAGHTLATRGTRSRA